MSGIFPSRRATSRLMLSCLLVASIGGSSLAQAPRRPRTPGDPVPTPTPAPTPQPPTPTPAPNPMPQQPGTPGQPGQPGARPGFPGLGQAPRPAGPRPYKEVITAEAKTDPGSSPSIVSTRKSTLRSPPKCSVKICSGPQRSSNCPQEAATVEQAPVTRSSASLAATTRSTCASPTTRFAPHPKARSPVP